MAVLGNRYLMLALPLPTDDSRPRVVADNAFIFAALASRAFSRASNLYTYQRLISRWSNWMDSRTLRDRQSSHFRTHSGQCLTSV